MAAICENISKISIVAATESTARALGMLKVELKLEKEKMVAAIAKSVKDVAARAASTPLFRPSQ